jgi:cell division protein FtsQ
MSRNRAKTKKPARRFGWRRVLSWHPSPLAVKASAVLLVVGGLGAVAIFEWNNGMPQTIADIQVDIERQAIAASARAGLAVRDVLVEGRIQTDPRDLRAVLDARRGAPILAFDPYAAKAELEQLPWVRRAEVRRQWPGALEVVLTEHVPLARWGKSGWGLACLLFPVTADADKVGFAGL